MYYLHQLCFHNSYFPKHSCLKRHYKKSKKATFTHEKKHSNQPNVLKLPVNLKFYYPKHNTMNTKYSSDGIVVIFDIFKSDTLVGLNIEKLVLSHFTQFQSRFFNTSEQVFLEI